MSMTCEYCGSVESVRVYGNEYICQSCKNKMGMTEREFAYWLAEQIESNFSDAIPSVKSICTFEDRGLLTRDEGLVISLEDGSEFQVTVVQSKKPKDW